MFKWFSNHVETMLNSVENTMKHVETVFKYVEIRDFSRLKKASLSTYLNKMFQPI